MSNRIKSEEIQIGNNYVLPIEQSGVTRQQAKVKKIIEETDAITKKMLDDAENKSQVIVGTASTEAERIIENSKKQAQADYDSIKQLSTESKDKLKKIKPKTIGQALRIGGVKPADISILTMYLRG